MTRSKDTKDRREAARSGEAALKASLRRCQW